MPNDLARRLAPLPAGLALLAAGCHAFVLHEERVAPDPAPITSVDVAGGDTTYVLRAPSYALLSHDRAALWAHPTLDDAARRFRWLFGSVAPAVALRVDTARAASPAVVWHGLPLVTVAPATRRDRGRDPREDVAFAPPRLAAAAARSWVGALETAWKMLVHERPARITRC